MAEEEDKIVNIPPPEEDEQLTDILLVYDKEEHEIRAVKGIDEKNGELETVPADKEHEQDFMRVDAHGNILSNFFSNFWRQVKNPSRFSFFKVPSLVKLNEKDLKKHQVNANDYKPKNKEKMAKEKEIQEAQEVKETTTTEQEQPQTQEANPENEQENEYRYSEEEVDWDTMSKLGINKEYLEKRDMLDPLLKGYKTDRLVPISMNLGSAVTRFDARLALRKSEDGVKLEVHGVRKEPQLNYPFFGHEFTDEDKENLLKTGNMGRVVELDNVKTGGKIPSVISIDELTNEIIACRTEYINIPDEIKGVKLNEEQKQTLQEGKPLYLEGMISKKGEPFNANLQFNADKRYVEFLFEDNLAQKVYTRPTYEEAPREVRGRELTEEQYKDFSQGKPVYIEGLISNKTGREYSGFFKYNENTGKVKFSFQNPDKKLAEDKVSRKVKENKKASSTTQTTTETKKETTGKGTKTTTTKKTSKRTVKPKAPAKKKSSGPKI